MSAVHGDRADMTPAASMFRPRQGPAHPLILDLFTDDRRRGRVIGTTGAAGHTRRGVDVEGVLAIDHGALRIQPLVVPGWGRSGVAYGPIKREPGLALAVHLVNGHNLSQTYVLPSVAKQVWRWMRAAGSDPVPLRMVNWVLFHHPRESFLRKLRAWHRSRKRRGGATLPVLRENLAVGWFASESPRDPLREGNAFVIHGREDYDNGEMWARVGDVGLRAFKSLQNVPLYYVVVLRERGAAYYAASLPGAFGLGAYPSMRPIAIDPNGDDQELYAGVHQSVLGEIGFGIDTRVYGLKAQRIPELSPWYGSAHAADEPEGAAPSDGTEAEVGGPWRVAADGGGGGRGESTAAILDPGSTSGLVHAMIDLSSGPGAEAGLIWRAADAENCWALVLSPRACRLEVRQAGRAATIADAVLDVPLTGEACLQVLDDGRQVTATVDGRLVFGRWIDDTRLADLTGVGVHLPRAGAAAIRSFEAHPREVPIPTALDMGPPWAGEPRTSPTPPTTAPAPVRDDFTGPGRELQHHTTTTGNKRWQRSLGRGIFETTGESAARVRADPTSPCPGRTIYTIPWDDPTFADVEVEITPPGTGRFQKQNSRVGLVFWQDPRNYILVCLWLDDSPLPPSISSFFCLRGFEDIYDAVWTCIGQQRATWGAPLRLRIAFDADRYLVRVNGEPVLSRALSDVYPAARPFRINRVGLVSTWEWGNDTGSVFRNFTARAGNAPR